MASPNANLGDITNTMPVYAPADYEADAADAGVTVEHAVHVETMVGQEAGGVVLDTLAESRSLVAHSRAFKPKLKVVAFVQLARPDCEEVIKGHLEILGKAFVGVRMILVRARVGHRFFILGMVCAAQEEYKW